VVASNVSISALFVAGVMPGIVIGLLIMGVALVVSRKKGYGGDHEQIEGQIRRSTLVTT
jgi:C4-dicarboxylate transporter DctM subunit